MRTIMAVALVFAAFLSAAWPADAVARASGYVNPEVSASHSTSGAAGTAERDLVETGLS
jgi:hypothetical protein